MLKVKPEHAIEIEYGNLYEAIHQVAQELEVPEATDATDKRIQLAAGLMQKYFKGQLAQIAKHAARAELRARAQIVMMQEELDELNKRVEELESTESNPSSN